jgi:DNA-binding transcriptional MerR regulator
MQIPDDKTYFRIGEVSRITGLEPYVLRYWESEFPQIRPRRADSNQRTYRKKDLEIIMEIKRLLYDERLTIEGARKKLKQKLKKKKGVVGEREILAELKSELQDILRVLSP